MGEDIKLNLKKRNINTLSWQAVSLNRCTIFLVVPIVNAIQ
jgi:hypothetical protein